MTINFNVEQSRALGMNGCISCLLREQYCSIEVLACEGIRKQVNLTKNKKKMLVRTGIKCHDLAQKEHFKLKKSFNKIATFKFCLIFSGARTISGHESMQLNNGLIKIE